MNRAAALLSRLTYLAGGIAGGTGLYIAYDYNTCHPMRKFTGYKLDGAWIRFYNTLQTSNIIIPLKSMTIQDLATYNGQNGQPIYFACNGYIWDVTQSEMFDNVYGQWRGKDATVALAKMSMSPHDVNRTDWQNLSPEDRDSCQNWTRYFFEKYYIRGRLIEFENEQQRQRQQEGS